MPAANPLIEHNLNPPLPRSNSSAVTDRFRIAFKAFLGASENLLRNIHGVATVAEFDGDEVGYLVAKEGGIKRQR